MSPQGDSPSWLLPIVLVFLVLPAAVGLAVAVVPVLKAYRMRRAGAADDVADGCPACGEGRADSVAPEVLRCSACGMVRGPGVVAWRRQEHEKRLAKASPEERLASALAQLREARGIVQAAQALLDDAASRSRWDVAGFSWDRGRAKQSSFGAAVRHLRCAVDLSRDAFELLRVPGPVEVPDFDASPLLLEADTAWITDGLIPDAMVHARIREAKHRATRMLEGIDAALARIDGGGR